MEILASPSHSSPFPYARDLGSSAPSASLQSYLSSRWHITSLTSCAAKKRPGQAWRPYPKVGNSGAVITSWPACRTHRVSPSLVCRSNGAPTGPQRGSVSRVGLKDCTCLFLPGLLPQPVEPVPIVLVRLLIQCRISQPRHDEGSCAALELDVTRESDILEGNPLHEPYNTNRISLL